MAGDALPLGQRRVDTIEFESVGKIGMASYTKFSGFRCQQEFLIRFMARMAAQAIALHSRRVCCRHLELLRYIIMTG